MLVVSEISQVVKRHTLGPKSNEEVPQRKEQINNPHPQEKDLLQSYDRNEWQSVSDLRSETELFPGRRARRPA
jgi:hypothetical protein